MSPKLLFLTPSLAFASLPLAFSTKALNTSARLGKGKVSDEQQGGVVYFCRSNCSVSSLDWLPSQSSCRA